MDDGTPVSERATDRDSQPSEARAQVLAPRTEVAADCVGQMVVFSKRMEQIFETNLTRLEQELKKNIDLQSDVQRKLEEISGTLQKEIENLRYLKNGILPRLESTRSRPLSRMRTVPLAQIAFAAGPERANNIFLGLSCQIIVACFLHSFPSLRCWMSDRAWNGLRCYSQILKPVSGLSVLMFAAENNQKSKYATPPGLVWSYLLRRTMMFVLFQARTKLFRNNLPPTRIESGTSSISAQLPQNSLTADDSATSRMPNWLLAFADKDDIREVVNQVSTDLETKAGDASTCSGTSSGGSWTNNPESAARSSSPLPRGGRGGTPPLSGGGTYGRRSRGTKRKRSLSDRENLRRQAVEECRVGLTQHLNNGRGSCRVVLYSSLLFIVDKTMRFFPSADEARANGYYVQLRYSSPEQLEAPSSSPRVGSEWDIPTAVVGTNQSSVRENVKRFDSMKAGFPCMNVEFQYNRMVVKDAARASGTGEMGVDGAQTADVDGDEVSSANQNNMYEPINREVIYVPTSETRNLHDVALNVLMEVFQTKDKGTVLGSSELALRAIHILALGLRGLLGDAMNLSTSRVEQVAKGDHVGVKTSDIVNVMLTRTWKGGETKLFREQYEAKFHMSWDEYCARRNAPDPTIDEGDELRPDVSVREGDDDDLFYCA